MALTDINIKKAKPGKKAHKLTDGGGLYLQIEPPGGKLWRFDYRFEGKRKTLALGKYPGVSLQEARKLLSQGIDPMAAKRAHNAAGKERAANSFEAVAREWYEVWKTGKHVNHSKLAVAHLEKHVFSYIGGRPISEISVPEVLTVLRRIEEHSIDVSKDAVAEIETAANKAANENETVKDYNHVHADMVGQNC